MKSTVLSEGFVQEAIAELIKEKESVELQVTGNSMRPYLRGDGSETYVLSKPRYDELKPGAIILFLYHGKYIIHRIIRKTDSLLIVQGDGNCAGIEKVEQGNVIGVVHTIVRAGGKRVSANSFSANTYWRVWYMLRPVRKYLLFIYNRLNK